MFEESVGKTLKIIAIILGFAGVFLAIATGSYIVYDNNKLFLCGVLIAFGGMIIACALGFIVYGFGELLEKVENIENKLNGKDTIETTNKEIDNEEKVEKVINQEVENNTTNIEEDDNKE